MIFFRETMNRMVFYLKCTLFQKKKYICSIARIIARNNTAFFAVDSIS